MVRRHNVTILLNSYVNIADYFLKVYNKNISTLVP